MHSPRYAADTTVPVERSKAEIERLLTKYGADGYMAGWDGQASSAMIAFRFKDRNIRMTLPMPKFADYKTRVSQGRIDQDTRQRWRALLLVVKAKLEAVQSHVATFEQEFLPYIQMPDGRTVGETVLPQIAALYKSGAGNLRLLPGDVSTRKEGGA
jgi:hypothetical protein